MTKATPPAKPSGLVPFTLVQIAQPEQAPDIGAVVLEDAAVAQMALRKANSREQIIGALQGLTSLATSWQALTLIKMTPHDLTVPHKPAGKRDSGIRECRFAGTGRSGTGISNYN